MEVLKYKVIKTKEQYYEYCRELERIDELGDAEKFVDEAELLTLLIETYDAESDTSKGYDPVEMLQSLMADHRLRASNIAVILNVSKGYISDILHYKKGMSKDIIRKLSDHFKVNQKAFNRPYALAPDRNKENSDSLMERVTLLSE